MRSQIKDLHGNIFKVNNYKLCLEISTEGNHSLIFTRDYVSGETFVLYVGDNKYFGYFYNQSMNLWVRYKLTLTGYDINIDIRKSHLWKKKK